MGNKCGGEEYDKPPHHRARASSLPEERRKKKQVTIAGLTDTVEFDADPLELDAEFQDEAFFRSAQPLSCSGICLLCCTAGSSPTTTTAVTTTTLLLLTTTGDPTGMSPGAARC